MPLIVLILVFIIVPAAELSLLIDVGSNIGVASTILMVIFTGVLGAYLVRQQGIATINEVRVQSAQGQMPAMKMAEGVCILIAGISLITPGFITDGIGFALLLPPLRRGIIKLLTRNGVWQVQGQYSQQRPYSTHQSDAPQARVDSTIIEGEYTEKK